MATKSLSPPSPPKKTKSLFPLLKGLRTSQSTPVVGRNSKDAPAQINFYKNDDNNDAKHFIFATDAIVDHPLRIGVGYGSYICYSCTILSDKVSWCILKCTEGWILILMIIGRANYSEKAIQ